MSRPYDVVVYGASGFTGQFAAMEAVRVCKGKKIALAGRTKSKLENVLQNIEKELGKTTNTKPRITSNDFFLDTLSMKVVLSDHIKANNLQSHNAKIDQATTNVCIQSSAGTDIEKIGIVVADSKNEESILEMCRQTQVVINCVGPFRWYGEQVVCACVETATNYVDITGEPEFMQTCQIKYHKEAEEKGIHIVSACGFDSVPADFGLEILREKFPGVLTAAESYIHLYGAGKANYGTYLTIIHSIQHRENVKAQQKAIYKQKIPWVGPRLRVRNPGFSKSENKWYVPFLGADPSVVKRTQYFESTVHDRTPVQYFAYITMPSFIYMMFLMLFGLILFVFTKFSNGIKLLENYPKVFSFGVFSKDGVAKEDLDKSGFKIVFHGKGYKKEPESRTTAGRPDQSLSLKITGPECGYIFTSSCVVAAAATILDDQLVNKGGVLTPASAFRGSKFVSRLQDRNVKIEVL